MVGCDRDRGGFAAPGPLVVSIGGALAMSDYPLDHALGYGVVPRDARHFEPLVRDHVAFAIWTLLHLHARSEPGWAAVAGGSIRLERGQCALSEVRIARRLGVDRKTVHRKLVRLERWGLVTRKAGSAGTVETLLGYGEYRTSPISEGQHPPQHQGQHPPQPSGHPSPQHQGQQSPHEGTENGPERETENGTHSAREDEADPEPHRASPAVREVVAVFNKCFGSAYRAEDIAGAIEPALELYTPAQLRLVAGWAAAVWSEDVCEGLSPWGLYRLDGPPGKTLHTRVTDAESLHRAELGPVPWEETA